MSKRKVWLVLLLAVLIYLIMIVYADAGNLAKALGGFDWPLLLVLIGLTLVGYLIRFIKWSYLVKKAGVSIGIKENLFVYFSGMSMIITPGKVGELWKCWLVKDMNGEKINRTLPPVIVDRMTDVISLLALSVLGIVFYGQGMFVIAVIAIALASLVLVVRSKSLLTKFLPKLLSRYNFSTEDAAETASCMTSVTDARTLAAASILGIAAWSMECIGLVIVLQGFGSGLGIVLCAFIYSFASLAGAASMVPGGLGVSEATITSLLVTFGIGAAVAVGASTIVRAGTLWFGAGLGMIVYLSMRHKFVKGPETPSVSEEVV